MAKLIYQHPADNRADDVTPTPSTADAAYPIANLYDLNPAKPFKFTAATGNIVWDFTEEVIIDLVSIIHHNLTPGIEVRIQANSSDDWGSPPLDQLLTIETYDLDGWPVNVFHDLTVAHATRSYQFWRLVIVDSNTNIIQLGDVWLGSNKRELNVDIKYPVAESIIRPVIEHMTDYDIATMYELGTKIKRFEAECQALNPTVTNAIRDWWDACHGRAKPILIYPDTEADDVYGAMLVRWTEQARVDRHVFPRITDIPLSFTEVSRGLIFANIAAGGGD